VARPTDAALPLLTRAAKALGLDLLAKILALADAVVE
jgi:hypothetical protein